MIKETIINGELFQEQRTYYIYRSEADRTAGKIAFVTSDKKKFDEMKRKARKKKSGIIHWSPAK